MRSRNRSCWNRAALDAPGEWFLARDGTLSYIPRKGETVADVWAPVAPQWIVKLEPDYELVHEWRDSTQINGKEFQTDPAIKFRKGALFSQGKKLADFPANTWLHVDLSAKIGDGRDNTFDLMLTLPGGQPQRFEKLPFVSKLCAKIDWLGFSSPGKEAAKCWLDELVIENTAGNSASGVTRVARASRLPWRASRAAHRKTTDVLFEQCILRRPMSDAGCVERQAGRPRYPMHALLFFATGISPRSDPWGQALHSRPRRKASPARRTLSACAVAAWKLSAPRDGRA